ncbi:MAG: hypothetical protein H0V89_00935 [Deltaproteobacteria bacterium]|nr:hypothetical protein [Deltaproteobacteria bacterium]
MLVALGAGVAWGWARSHPDARERVVLARDCDVWAFDASGAATVIGRARAGEGFEVTAEDARSVRILRDGLPAWVVRECAP